MLAWVNEVGMEPGTSEDIDIEMPDVETRFDWLWGVDSIRGWLDWLLSDGVRFDTLKPGNRFGCCVVGVTGEGLPGNVALNRGELDWGCCAGDMIGSIRSELGNVVGKLAAPFVRVFLMRQQAMLNSFLSSLPSLFKSARPQIWPRIGVGRFDFKKNSRAFSPVNSPLTGPSCIKEASCFVRSSILIFQSILVQRLLVFFFIKFIGIFVFSLWFEVVELRWSYFGEKKRTIRNF